MLLNVVVLAAIASFHGAGARRVDLPAGTVVPVRFLQTIQGGRDSIGTPVRVLTMAAIDEHGCVAIPAFTEARGRITLSRAGRIFGGRSALAIELDSLEVGVGRWVAIQGVLEALEYTPVRDVTTAGVVHGRATSFASRSVVVVGMAASDLAVAPIAILGGYWFARHGPPAR